MASVKEFLFISWSFYHCSLRCIDFFVSPEYMVLSSFVVTKLGRKWESVYLMLKIIVFKVIINLKVIPRSLT